MLVKDGVKHAASAEGAVHADRATLRLDEVARQRETETGAGVELAGARFELLEFDEQALHVLGRDADAGVLDLEPTTSSTRDFSSTVSGRNSSLPASIVARSSTSLMSCRRCCPLVSMSPRNS